MIMSHFMWIFLSLFLILKIVNSQTPSDQDQSTLLELESRLKKLANIEHLTASLQEIISKNLDYLLIKNMAPLANSLPEGNLFKYLFRILVITLESESTKNPSNQDTIKKDT